MAGIVRNTAEAAGAERVVVTTPRPREKRVEIYAKGGAHLSFDIDGDCPVLGGTWSTPERVWLNPARGDVNPHHFGKLNRLYCDFETILRVISSDLECFASGSGYLPETDHRIVAMRDRYRQRGWDWFGEPA